MDSKQSDARGRVELPPLRVRNLLASQASSLKLHLEAGKKGLGRPIDTSRVERPWHMFSGKEEAVSRGSVQLFGTRELDSLSSLPTNKRKRLLDDLSDLPIAALVISDGLAVPSYLRSWAGTSSVAVLCTPLDASVAARRIRRFLEKMGSGQKIVHGVLMDIYGLGTLIIGESGIGKSESALELIERGHRLVSDDVIEIYRPPKNEGPGSQGGTLMGRSPKLTRYFMELRGLGIINVRDLFGPSSIRMSKSVDLVIKLERWEKTTDIERLGLEEESYSILGGRLPLVRMPVGPGRNLAMLIEVAARNHLLKQSGRHPAHRLMKRVSSLSRRGARRQG